MKFAIATPGNSVCSCSAESYIQRLPSYIQSLASHEDIDRESAAVQAAWTALRTRRNEIAPINSLPDEVLARIFKYCMPQGIVTKKPDYTYGAQFMLVCRAWCAVAHEHPTIWASISCIDPVLTKILLTRSKMALIDVNTFIGRHAARVSQQLALPHLGRMRTLNFSMNASDTLEDCVQILASTSAPQLASACFMAFSYTGEFFRLPDTLFNLDAPRLRTLSFTNCLFDWRILTIHSLTGSVATLRLTTCLSTVELTVHSFWSAMKAMPSLTKLSLQFQAGSIRGHSMPYSAGRVELQNLQELDIHGPPDDVSTALRAVSIPAGTKLDIDFILSTPPSPAEIQPLPDLSAVTEFLGSHGSSADGPAALRRLVITGCRDKRRVTIQGLVEYSATIYSKPLLSVSVTRPLRPAHQQHGFARDHARQLRALVAHICPAIHLARVTAVELQLDVVDTKLRKALCTALAPAGGVTCLCLQGMATQRVDILVPQRATGEGEWRMLFPRLAELTLIGVPRTTVGELVESTLQNRREHCASQDTVAVNWYM